MSAPGGKRSSSARVRKHRLLNKLLAKRPRLDDSPTGSSSSSNRGISFSSESNSDDGTDADNEFSQNSDDQDQVSIMSSDDEGEPQNINNGDHELDVNIPEDQNYSNDEPSDYSNRHSSSSWDDESDNEGRNISSGEQISGSESDSADNENSADTSDASDGSEMNPNPSVASDESSEEDEISQLKIWSIGSRIPNKHLDTLLGILRQRLLPGLPKNSKTFLGTNKAKYNIRSMTDSRGEEGEFVYMGIAEGLKACLNVHAHLTRVIDLMLNIDGVKIHKSSQMTMWPILCKIHCTPDIYNPFPVAVFYGNGKPKNFEEFFVDFIIEMNHLMEHGLEIQSIHSTIQIKCFTCDKPATDAVKGVKGHTSFDGCGRCTVKGEKVDNVTVYLHLDCEKRTAEGFRNFEHVNHHNSPSPLLALVPSLDFIYRFVLEPMHAIHLGVTPRLMLFLMKGFPNSPVMRLSAQQKVELNRRTKKIKKDIPYEFKRKMRSTDFYEDYHAVENRFFLLYCGPIVFKKILNNEYYHNFLLLHLFVRMLSSPEAVQYTNLARQFSHEFIEGSRILYGSAFVTMNVHSASHMADDVDNMQCGLDEISAFPYENELGKIKRILLSPHRTLAQYCRRIHIQRSTDMVPQLPRQLRIVKNTATGISEIQYKHHFLSVKHPNNTALLDNGRPVKLHKFHKVDGAIYVKVSLYHIKKPIFTHHYNSSLLNMYEVEERRNSNEFYVNIHRIAGKMVKFSINFSDDELDRTFLMPFIH
ncbi:hypothetical protein QAD02_007720 [Eretmocerus hayati]|uniref:Uncharacterized protein n=1 Tax=Eretmocerus hayati TaxID=131215 RepID=A0ACC2N553_9HYME|nr:hypothetical protein QAD02_007720 [Eretmocerus hayati]